jgi:hypothetical protein
MFEKIGRLAEAAANKVSVSRRGFLGRLGQGALAMTGVLGGLLAIPTAARAGGSYVCCTWTCNPGVGGKKNSTRSFCYPPGSHCYSPSPCPYGGSLKKQASLNSCPYGGSLKNQTTINSCDQCK